MGFLAIGSCGSLTRSLNITQYSLLENIFPKKYELLSESSIREDPLMGNPIIVQFVNAFKCLLGAF